MEKSMSRSWILTINNSILEWDEIVTISKADYLCGQMEKGKEGTPHWQLALWYKSKQRFSALKKKFQDAHIEKMESDKGFEYCVKEDTRIKGPFYHGTCPIKRNSKLDWQKVWDWAVAGDLQKIDPKIRVCQYRTLRTIRADNLKMEDKQDTRGIWIWGAPGVGKSHWARKTLANDNYFIKPTNKWWDGYKGEPFAILEDLDKDSAKFMGHFLKIWADKWSFHGEVKFGGEAPNYQKFVVTSNYKPNELFDDTSLVAAITRRFQIFEMVGQSALKDSDGDIQNAVGLGQELREEEANNLEATEEIKE